jgi:sirohydrochlorin cobaltochelatase
VTDPALLIVGHGSRAPAASQEFHRLADRVRALAPELAVAAGFIELAAPPLGEAVAELVGAGRRELVAVPLMLLAAGHTKNDIPASLARERVRHPGVSITYSRELGIRSELLELVDRRIAAAVDEAERADTAVVLVGRGTTDPDANGDLAKIARLFYEGRSFPFVEPAFVSLAPPSVQQALERCRRLGARRVVVMPYFLFTGVLEERIRAQAADFAARAGIEVRVAGYFGVDDVVAQLVLARYREACAGGDLRMNCDTCVHRVALPGFEAKVGAPATPHFHAGEDGHAHAHDHAHPPHPNAAHVAERVEVEPASSAERVEVGPAPSDKRVDAEPASSAKRVEVGPAA